jgi:branched-chain amino acid transport system substrate-binding protein
MIWRPYFLLIGALLLCPRPAAAFPDISAGQGVYDDPGITDTEITIGLFAPLSGPTGDGGTTAITLAKAWYDMVNQQGGIWGRKIRLVIEDDRCNANDLLTAVKKLVEQDKVFLLNGGFCSAALVGAQDYIVRNKVPLVVLQASADGMLFPPNDYVFGAFGLSQHSMGGSAIDFAQKFLKAKRIAYVKHDDNYGGWNFEAADWMMKQKGIDFADVESINPAIVDVSAPALKIRAAQPDAIVLAVYPQPATLLIKRLYEFGVKAPIIITAAAVIDTDRMVENVGTKEAFANSYIQDVINDLATGPKQKWVRDLYAKAAPDKKPIASMPYAIGSMQAVTYALLLAGPNPTREAVLRSLATLHFETGIMAGPIEFNANKHSAQEAAIFLKFDGTSLQRVPGSYASGWTYGAH